MAYGNSFHKAAEKYLRDGVPLPIRFQFVQKALDSLGRVKGKKLFEYKMGLTNELSPCGFNSSNVWYRGIADLVIIQSNVAKVLDYKTSKSTRYADKKQLELMALCIFRYFPEVEIVDGALLFVKLNSIVTQRYSIKQANTLWNNWFGRHHKMKVAFKHDVWNANPSGLCRNHCAVLECPHNGRN